MPSGAVRIPVLTSRSWIRWVGATGVAVVVALGWIAVTQPQHRLAVSVVTPGLVVAGVLAFWSSTWVDPGAGAFVRVRLGRFRRRVPLGPATSVSLVPSGAGTVLLAVRASGSRRGFFVTVLALTDYVERSLPPDLLRLLADTLESQNAGGSRDALVALRAQADHLAAGGDARTSPLAGRVTYGALTAAKIGGAGGIGGHLG
ncbi:MAG TPA: hypothetical protein VGC57_03400 [Cellulomonas sp.]